nr:apoptotic chromatin condensation inducer in the nucleus isoform X1 [Onthophagus taurus]
MRRKSTRNAAKAQEKAKPAEQPTRKSRRTSKRRRKSTSSESEKSEEEQEMPQMVVAEAEKVASDSEVNSTLEENTEKEVPQIIEKKTRRNKASSSPMVSDSKLAEEGNENKSRNSNRLRQREATKPEDDVDGEGRADKGKSKGKTRAKVDHEPTDASGTVTESEICTNAQVTPLSPQTDINNAVTCESIVTQSAADSVDDKPTIDQEPDCTRSDDHNDDKDVESSVDVVDSSTNDNVTNLDITNNDIKSGEGDEVIPIKSPVCTEQTEHQEIVDSSNDGTGECKQSEMESIKASESEKLEILDINKKDESLEIKDTDEKKSLPDQKLENDQNDITSPKKDEYPVPMEIDESQTEILEKISITLTEGTKSQDSQDEKPCDEIQQDLKIEEKMEQTVSKPPETSQEPIRQQEVKPEEIKLRTYERKASVQKIKIKRTSTSDETNETQPKRRWGKGLKLISAEIIDSNVVMNIYPDVQFLEESDVKLEHTEPKIRRFSTAESSEDKSDRRMSLDFERQTSEESFKTEVEPEEKTNIIAFNRKISIIDDSATTLKPPPSPAKNPVSDTLFITNLVRPFTLKQLRELLERTGKIKEDGFWTDRIKSKCYVQYESEEEARGTREALHGVHWPIGNGKKLIIDYSTEEELANAKNPPAPPPPAPVVLEPSKSDKENEDLHRTKKEDRKSKERDEKETRRREHVREWDVGKEDVQHKSKSDHDHDRRKHSRRSSTPRERDDYLAKKRKKVEDQIPQKLMDDLFQKTTATPSIYWQPLTPEEIATKQQQRLERMAEHKKRMEETSSRPRVDYGRGGPYRRKYD